jgi:drug/metabolite transporter (DMT)-like permease
MTEIPEVLATEGSEVLLSRPAKRALRPSVLAWLLLQWWIAFAASALFVVSGHLTIKAGLNALTPVPASTGLMLRVLQAVLQPEVLTGLLIYLLGTVCWIRAVSQKEISFLYPLSSVNYVLVAAISTVIFREVISVRRAAGVIVIVLGMILMNRQSGDKTT